MYFIPFIRDYVEVLNNIYDSMVNDISFQKILQEIFIYLFHTFKYIIFYLFTFQWIRDLIYLPIIIPQISNSILKENFFLQTPLDNFFNFLQIPTYNSNKFFIGFLNSFFLSLPFSCAHLIFIRRLLIQGNVAGIAAGLGTIFGQISFIGSIILGFRFFIIPWFYFEPLSYIIGLFLLISVVYDMVHERVIKIIDWNNKSIIFKIFLLNFFLIWTEQSCIFQFLTNLTGGAESSVLDNFLSTTNLNFLINHLNYLLGLFLGSLFFNLIFAFLFKNLAEYIQIKFSLLRSTWIIRLNFSLLSLILAFSFSSIPFYGLDYLIVGPLGFISNDKAFKNTFFSTNELKDSVGVLGGLSNNLSLDTDVTSFDKGIYLKAPILQTFEDLNYSGEYASTVRQGNIPLYDQYKEKARRIRDIIVKKTEDEKETQQPNSLFTDNNIIKNEQQTNPYSNLKTSKKRKTGSFDYPTFYPVDYEVSRSFNIQTYNIQKRFENNYKESSNMIFETILKRTLNNVFSDEKFTVAYPEIEKKIKERYYTNPIYKFLLTLDVDNFLRRQPSKFLLSSDEEKALYKKRLMLGRYHDTLRYYNTLPYSQEFQYFFNGSKSFADRVYNQQFKGTLHIVRRLFSISFNLPKTDNSLNSEEKILKYDQSLFKTKKEQKFNFHEELEENIYFNSPFLEEISQNPLYLGWDDSLKKIIITNNLLPKSLTNFKNFQNKKENFVEFITWPIKKDQLNSKNNNFLETSISKNSKFLFETKPSVQQLNYNNLLPLFEYDDRESRISYYRSLPHNIIKLYYGFFDVIPPNRGGFVWPGNSSLKFSLTESFK